MAETTVFQRPLRGSRIATFYPVKSLPSLSSLDSAFQLQEYISLLIRLDVHDVQAIVAVPGKKEKSWNDLTGPFTNIEEKEAPEQERKNDVVVDEACWIYEQLRRLAQDLSHPLITMLQQECTRASCPEMKAGEWLYLCVAHGNDGAMEQCCAIDYILHTLDSATALLNSPRAFPSRLCIPQTSHRHFSSLARRLGRIFAHAYFHHREVFEQAEAESSLYERFLALTSRFDLVPAEFLVIPSRPEERGEPELSEREENVLRMRRLLGLPIANADEGETLAHHHAQREQTQEERVPMSDWPNQREVTIGGNLSGFHPTPQADNDGQRRFGRQRTDTMVFNDLPAPEEIAKVGSDEYGAEHPGPLEQDRQTGVDTSRYLGPTRSSPPPPEPEYHMQATGTEEQEAADTEPSPADQPEPSAPSQEDNFSGDSELRPAVITLPAMDRDVEDVEGENFALPDEPVDVVPTTEEARDSIDADPSAALAGLEKERVIAAKEDDIAAKEGISVDISPSASEPSPQTDCDDRLSMLPSTIDSTIPPAPAPGENDPGELASVSTAESDTGTEGQGASDLDSEGVS